MAPLQSGRLERDSHGNQVQVEREALSVLHSERVRGIQCVGCKVLEACCYYSHFPDLYFLCPRFHPHI